MSGKLDQIPAGLRRMDILLTVIFFILYAVWIAWPTYGCLPLFGFVLIIAYNVSKSQNGLRRFSDKMREEHPEQLSDAYWMLLRRYGVAIYTPKAAEPVAAAFSRCELFGYAACIVFILMQRWVEVVACFSSSMLAVHMKKLLAPEIQFDKLAKKKPEYAAMAEAIRELKKWVQSAEAP